MYSFAERPDVRVVDEPLYAHYLSKTGADHPGKDEIIAAMNNDGNAVMQQLLVEQSHIAPTTLFLKHMAHHLVDIDLGFLGKTANIFLVRDPREMLPSLTVQLPQATLADSGLKRQWQLFEQLSESGQSPAILDSQELLLNPRTVLGKLCAHLGLDFDETMLSWEPGARAEDGVWAEHWYHAVHKSSGFAAYQAKQHFPPDLQPLLDDCKPWYDKLFASAIRA